MNDYEEIRKLFVEFCAKMAELMFVTGCEITITCSKEIICRVRGRIRGELEPDTPTIIKLE